MYHSITFGNKNTWTDWHLIPKTRPVVNPPQVKTNYVEIPGGDGVLDLTVALSGRPLYKNRTGSFEFYVENGFMPWSLLYSKIMEHLQGQRMQMVLEDDPAYFYEGRYSVNAWKSDAHRSSITIDYNVGPYKYYVFGVTDDWDWDSFNLETGIIRSYNDIDVNGSRTINIVGTTTSTTLVIVTSVEGMSVSFNGRSYGLERGVNVIKDTPIQNGDNYITFYGSGRVTIEYNGGAL